MIAKRMNPKIGRAIAKAIIMPKIPSSAVVINLCMVSDPFLYTYIYAIAVPTFAFPYKSIGYARLPRTGPYFSPFYAPQWSTISINMIVI